MSLPSGFKKLEYIQSSGTQYIATGIIGSYDTRVTAEFEILSIGSGTVFVFGSQANNNVRFCLGITSAGVFRSDYGTEYISGPSAATGTKYTADKNRNVCTINGTAINSNAQTFTGTTNIYLFARSYSSLSYANLKMYGCKIYSNDVLVRDFIPCKNASGAVGMWDDVNSVFYGNAGSGTFTAGPEVAGSNRVLVDAKGYDAKSGTVLVNGMVYHLKKGRGLLNGMGYDIPFGGFDPVFANNDWAAIIEACQNQNVPDTWAVGDSKPMTINGTSYQIDIIGKNHDTYAAGGTAPLTFQMHDCYYINYEMNASTTNYDGWRGCAMRTTSLPMIMGLMPAEVQNGLKSVNKATGLGSNNGITVTTADKLFLLSEIEVTGTRSYSVNGEGTQYDYYKAGNSKTKSRAGQSTSWWFRSPVETNGLDFCMINANSVVNANNATASWNSTSFAFCF